MDHRAGAVDGDVGRDRRQRIRTTERIVRGREDIRWRQGTKVDNIGAAAARALAGGVARGRIGVRRDDRFDQRALAVIRIDRPVGVVDDDAGVDRFEMT